MKTMAQLILSIIIVVFASNFIANAGVQQISPTNKISDQYPWMNKKLSPMERANLVLKQMTLDEKLSMLSVQFGIDFRKKKKPQGAIGSAGYNPGVSRLGIPAVQESDAGLGIANPNNARPGDNATALPSSLLLGSAFDPSMAEQGGSLIGNEAYSKGFNVLLAGGANLTRESRGGRNFEYVSEDPLLTAIIVGNLIKGVQEQHVISTIKHFALNDQENGRMLISTDMSEKNMRESDLLAFQIAIEIGHPGSVMSSYNLINGEYASENKHLLTDILKQQWGFDGWIMSDWGATHSTSKALNAGLDVQSGYEIDDKYYFSPQLLKKELDDGKISQTRIDDAVRRQLISMFKIGVIDNTAKLDVHIDYLSHKKIAQKLAEGGIILLKNDNILPLKKSYNNILVIGDYADVGVLSGGGSSSVRPVGSTLVKGIDINKVYHPSSPLLAIKSVANAQSVTFDSGNDLNSAIKKAKNADIIIIFAQDYRTESKDNMSLNLLNNQDALINDISKVNNNVIVVVQSGGAVAMPWKDHVRAILMSFYPGSGGAEAIANILFGRVNPSGRLPITISASVEQLPRIEIKDPKTTTSNPGLPLVGSIFHVSYDIEGADVGYRWFQKQNLSPIYPFGYGLSYSTFSYTKFSVNTKKFIATVTLKNTSNIAGKNVIQIYSKPIDNSITSSRLVGFTKVNLNPNEEKTVQIHLEKRIISQYSDNKKMFVLEPGKYTFSVNSDAITPIIEKTYNLN